MSFFKFYCYFIINLFMGDKEEREGKVGLIASASSIK